MPDFAVSTAFTAQDRVTKAFGSMGRGADKFGKKSTKAFRQASKGASQFQSITKGILSAGAISRGLGALTRGLGTVTREFIGFDQAVISASAKFKGLNLATAAGQEKLLLLKKTAREVGAATQFSAGQAAEGLDFLAMAGFNAEQAMASLPGVVDLATVANIDLARATDIASDSLGAFGLMTEDAIQLQKNFTRLNDVMALTMSRTNTNMEDMFEAVKKGAPAFTAAGQRIETFNALIGTMANSGVKGSEAGTSLRNVMLRLAKATPEAQKVMKKLGVIVQDSQGNFRDVVDIIEDFEKGLKGMGTAQKTAALTTVFGARAVTGMNIILKEGTKKIRAFREELDNSAGASKNMADIMRQSLGNRLKALQSAAIETGFKFFTAFEKQGGDAINKLTEIVRNFDINPIINAVKTTINVMTTLFNIMKPFAPLIQGIVAGFLAYSIMLKGLAIVQTVIGFIKFLFVLKNMVGTMGILNAVMTANPIGLIIVGVALLIGLMVVLEKKFKIFSRSFNAIKGFLGFGDGETPPQEANRQAPNAADVESRQNIAFKGQLNIAGAPPGSTVESETTGAPPVNVKMLGANE